MHMTGSPRHSSQRRNAVQNLLRVRQAYGGILTICGLISGWLTFAVMLLVVTNVVLRYGFNIPIPGTLELTEGALPLIIFLSLALTQFHQGHIKVVILTQHMPAGLRRVFRVLAMLVGAGLFAWAAWAGWHGALKSLAIGEVERGSIRYPIYPIKFAVVAGMVLLTIQFLLDALAFALGHDLDEIEEGILE